MQVEMDSTQSGVLEEFARDHEVSVADCVYDAVDDWIRSTLRSLTQTEPMNVIGFPERLSR